jgi:hypothetical protein
MAAYIVTLLYYYAVYCVSEFIVCVTRCIYQQTNAMSDALLVMSSLRSQRFSYSEFQLTFVLVIWDCGHERPTETALYPLQQHKATRHSDVRQSNDFFTKRPPSTCSYTLHRHAAHNPRGPDPSFLRTQHRAYVTGLVHISETSEGAVERSSEKIATRVRRGA